MLSFLLKEQRRGEPIFVFNGIKLIELTIEFQRRDGPAWLQTILLSAYGHDSR
jgi:hypothetical protein